MRDYLFVGVLDDRLVLDAYAQDLRQKVTIRNSSKHLELQRKRPVTHENDGAFELNSRRRPTLPHSYPCSTIGPERLNFRVRDGNGCDPLGIATEKPLGSCW